MSKEIELKTEYPSPNELRFTLSNGDKITIPKCDVDLIEKIQALSIEARIKIVALTDDDLLRYINKKRQSAGKLFRKLISDNWYYRSTGEKAECVLDEDGNVLTFTELRLKKQVSYKTALYFIEHLAGRNSDYYTKEINSGKEGEDGDR